MQIWLPEGEKVSIPKIFGTIFYPPNLRSILKKAIFFRRIFIIFFHIGVKQLKIVLFKTRRWFVRFLVISFPVRFYTARNPSPLRTWMSLINSFFIWFDGDACTTSSPSRTSLDSPFYIHLHIFWCRFDGGCFRTALGVIKNDLSANARFCCSWGGFLLATAPCTQGTCHTVLDSYRIRSCQIKTIVLWFVLCKCVPIIPHATSMTGRRCTGGWCMP